VIPTGVDGETLARMDGKKKGIPGPKLCVVIGCSRLRARQGKSFYCDKHEGTRVARERTHHCSLCGDIDHSAGNCWRKK
jgi:hypothetical protein